MENEKKEALDRALKLVIESLESGKDFVIEQAPLLVQEMVTYGIVSNALGIAALVVVSVLCAYGGCRLVRFAVNYEKSDICDDKGFGAALLGAVSCVVSVACVAKSATMANCLVMAWFAPRLYVLHELKGLL